MITTHAFSTAIRETNFFSPPLFLSFINWPVLVVRRGHSYGQFEEHRGRTHLWGEIIESDKMSVSPATALIDGGVFAPDDFTSGGQNITALTITDEWSQIWKGGFLDFEPA